MSVLRVTGRGVISSDTPGVHFLDHFCCSFYPIDHSLNRFLNDQVENNFPKSSRLMELDIMELDKCKALCLISSECIYLVLHLMVL